MTETQTAQSDNDLLAVTIHDQYHTAEELFTQSRPTSTYYLLLAISSVIVAAGLLLGSDAVIIGGALVAPLLTPILFVALALSAGKVSSLPRVSLLLLRSAGYVIALGFVMGFLFGGVAQTFALVDISRTAMLYLIVAFASGVAGAFAWARKDVAEVLPGIALSVSLLPPLAGVGISLEQLDPVALRFFIVIFLFNFFGILVGALIIFSLLKFYRTGEIIEEKEREEAFKEEVRAKAQQSKESVSKE